jgi:hypothetical protein
MRGKGATTQEEELSTLKFFTRNLFFNLFGLLKVFCLELLQVFKMIYSELFVL